MSIEFLSAGKNKLDISKVNEGIVINTQNIIESVAGYSCCKVFCVPNTNYAYSGFNLVSSGMRVYFMDINGAKISAITIPITSGTFKTPENCKSFYINTKWNNTSSYSTVQVEEGSIPTDFEIYSLSKIKRDIVEYPVPALPEILALLDGRINSLEINGTPHPFYGKIANFLGDSITTIGSSGATTASANYFNIFSENVGLSGVRPYGVPGNKITGSGGFSDRFSSMDGNADLICVFGGVNDYISNSIIGSITDTANSTFYGALNILMSGLLLKYNGKDIIFISPLHKLNDQVANTVGAVLQDYTGAILNCATKWGIPVLNLTANYGINPNITTGYFTDGTHPNDLGHDKIARKLIKFTNQL